MLLLAMLPHFTMFQYTICEFRVKKKHFLHPGADHGRKMDAAGMLGQRFFEENTKWRTKIHIPLIRVFQVMMVIQILRGGCEWG